ncbi:acetoacetate decarboxylase family protein [Bradyrhizobium sp. DASA03007]|uniref:acetoacetate decarboxylase family protein n=1 Tax=unclassified Bradyrhizobium TaxID=2631580 RepID=UPI003F70BD9E
MPIKGQLNAEMLEAPPPSLTSPYHTGPQHFVDASILKLEYETRAENVAKVVPNVFEVPDRPKAFVSFNYWGFSSVGTYTEVVQSVECSYRNETFFYPVRLYLDNDRAILAGREGFGIPKLTGIIAFDIAASEPIVSAKLERPRGILLAAGVFQADNFVGENDELVIRNWGLRVWPKAGRTKGIAELLKYTMTFKKGTIWSGRGSVGFTGFSAIDPLHELPVVEMTSATLLRGSQMRLDIERQERIEAGG